MSQSILCSFHISHTEQKKRTRRFWITWMWVRASKRVGFVFFFMHAFVSFSSLTFLLVAFRCDGFSFDWFILVSLLYSSFSSFFCTAIRRLNDCGWIEAHISVDRSMKWREIKAIPFGICCSCLAFSFASHLFRGHFVRITYDRTYKRKQIVLTTRP